MLDGMPIFVDPSAAGADGTLLPGEDALSQNVLIEKIFAGKKLVYLRLFTVSYSVSSTADRW